MCNLYKNINIRRVSVEITVVGGGVTIFFMYVRIFIIYQRQFRCLLITVHKLKIIKYIFILLRYLLTD